jgi:hypothetical protein
MRALLAGTFLLHALVQLGCGTPPPLTVISTADDAATVATFFEYTPVEGLELRTEKAPEDKLGSRGLRVAVGKPLDCGDCDPGTYRLEGGKGRYVIHAAGKLGVQYALGHILEAGGYRFFHPYRSVVPPSLDPELEVPGTGETHAPEMTVRGLHLHTLHPVESYFDFWEPGAENLEGARRTVDWVVKMRANYIQYTALDDILSSAQKQEAWRAHTRAILDYAHARGVKLGVGIQLFGQSNLQQAFDLLDQDSGAPRALIKSRLEVLTKDLRWDGISLSFGEFFSADPEAFVASVNLAVEVMFELLPEVEVNAPIHVGDVPELRVTYQGETLLYYFLVKFADPRIVPWVHSVMYYNLFEDAGGAYHHDAFPEHREFLLERLRDGKRVAYMPESAYWIAFDNSVPTYLPLYARSRWLDVEEIRKTGAGGDIGLREHALFSTGWEWGYWQTDYMTLRGNFRHPGSWHAPYAEMFAPWGEQGAAVAEALREVGELQHRALLEGRLAAYVAGRDQLIDAGKILNIISQPDRKLFSEVHAMSEADREAFASSVVFPLGKLATAHRQVHERIAALEGVNEDRWLAEIRDGVEITAHRIQFIFLLYGAVLAHAQSGTDAGLVDLAVAELAAARGVVSRRHANLHDPRGRQRLLTPRHNATVYHYGYLREANTLCFWNRERVEVQRLLFGSTESQPGCVL